MAVAKKTATKTVIRKPTKAKTRCDAAEKKIDTKLRKVAAEIDAAEPYSTDAEIDDLLKKADRIVAKKKPMGVSNVRRADNRGEVLTTIDASTLVDDGDEFGVGYMSFEQSLKEEIEVLKKDLAETNALLQDSEKKLRKLMEPKENWFVALFRTEERAG